MMTEADKQACADRIRAYVDAFHRGDSEAYADQWVFPGSVYSHGVWRQTPDRAACVAGNEAYYNSSVDEGLASGEIESLEVKSLGADAGLVEGVFLRYRADGSLMARIEAAYLVVRRDEGWKVAVCVVKT
jgi:hypothetical protein